MRMGTTHYLPNEILNYRNFPEVRQIQPQIDAVMKFAEKFDNATRNYQEGRLDKIDLNIDEVKAYISLCRQIGEVLGNASNVCYDVLLYIRHLQTSFQYVKTLVSEHGDKYVGTPTLIEESDV